MVFAGYFADKAGMIAMPTLISVLKVIKALDSASFACEAGRNGLCDSIMLLNLEGRLRLRLFSWKTQR